jgi:hypothetical protein
LVAIALRYPELRAEIAGGVSPDQFEDRALAAALIEVCGADEQQPALEIAVAEGLSDEQRGRLSAMMVGPLLEDAQKTQALAADYRTALRERQNRLEVEQWRRVAARAASSDEAKAAAQEALLALRRGAGGESR